MTWFKRDTFMSHFNQSWLLDSDSDDSSQFLNNPEFEHDFSSFDLEKYLFPSFTSFLCFFSFYH